MYNYSKETDTERDNEDNRLKPELLHPDAAMYTPHMVIHLTALLKRRKTLPAYVRLAVRTGNMVASGDPLNRCLATGAVLDVPSARPLLKQPPVFALAVCALGTLVALDVAVPADTDET